VATTGACLAALLFVGCGTESQQWIFSVFFDDADSPPPPRQRLRQDLLREIEELKQKLTETQRQMTEGPAGKATKEGAAREQTQSSVERAKSWQEATQLLPKDSVGHVDWGRALKEGTIAPRPSRDPKAPEQAPLDLNIELASSANKLYRVTFSHSAHTGWLTCGNCHPAIFPMRQAKPTVVTMAKIQAGQYCGVCHGPVAFGVDSGCARCHAKSSTVAEWRPSEEPRKPVERAKNWEEAAKALPVTDGMVNWSKALTQGVIAPRPGIDPKAEDQAVFPLDVELIPAAGEMFKAIFSHKSHTEWLGCVNCHNDIFQMAKGAAKMTMETINAGQYCGVCHGKVAFPATACGGCHPAMAGGK